MTRISVLCLAIAILFSQSAYAQPSIRLGAGVSKVITDASEYNLGYNAMAGVESPVSPAASILLEGGYLFNKIDAGSTGLDVSQKVIQANVGIKINSPLLYLVAVAGYNRLTGTIASGSVAVSVTDNNIGFGGGVGLHKGNLFGEARLYHSRAAECTYVLGLVGIQIP